MYCASDQNRDASEGPNEARESCKSGGESKNLLVSPCAATTLRIDGVAQRVMDDLLRECLRRKSLTPRVSNSAAD
jgi:hypothetical protein